MAKIKAQLSDLNKNLKQSHLPNKAQKVDAIEANVPRGERSEFLKISVTLPGSMLSALRVLGMQMKESGEKDSDTSALIRLAIAEFLNKSRHP